MTLLSAPAAPASVSAPPPQPHSAGPQRGSIVNMRTIGMAVALISFVALWFGLPEGNGLTHEGVRALAVIVPSLVLWLTNGTNWVSLLIMGLFIIANVLPGGGPGNVWATGIGNPIIALVIVYYILANTMAETGVTEKVAAWAISRPSLQGRPYAFLTVFFLSQMVLGFVMQNLALAVLYIEIAEKIAKQIGVKPGDKLYSALMLGVTWGNGVLLVGSPIAKTWPLAMMGFLAVHGIAVSFATWFAVGIPFTFVMTVVIMLAIRTMKADVSPLKHLDVTKLQDSTPPLSKQGKFIGWSFILLIAFVVIPEILNAVGITGGLVEWILSIGITAPAAVVVGVLCFVKMDGAPLCDFGKSLRDIHWGVVLFIAGIFVMQAPFSDPATGIQDWMGNIFQPIMGDLSPFWITAIAILGTMALTQFMSNGVTMTVFWTIGSALLLASSGTSNLAAFGVTVTFASCMAVLTGPATLTTALVYEPKHITPMGVLKPNLWFIGGSAIVLIAFIPFISAVFGG